MLTDMLLSLHDLVALETCITHIYIYGITLSHQIEINDTQVSCVSYYTGTATL